MRGMGLRAGVALAMVGVATPALGQISFIKCGNGDPKNELYLGIEGQTIYRWDAVGGLTTMCADALSIGDSCTMRVTDSAITVAIIGTPSDAGIIEQFQTIDRLSGRYRYTAAWRGRAPYITQDLSCARSADPRTAPRAF